jgi:gamma-glutamyl:cysteine ligase YbdK (ATP-grasp superfamily)
MRHVQDLARQAIDIARPHVAHAGAAASLQHVERQLAEGNGAIRQRAAYAEGGLPAVLRRLVGETTPHLHPASPVLAITEGAA